MQKRKTTKELIADSFIELSQEKNINKITIKNIVDNCELTPTTFYNHFKDKYDLIVWIYSAAVEKIMNKIDGENYFWKNTLSDGINFFLENKNFFPPREEFFFANFSVEVTEKIFCKNRLRQVLNLKFLKMA